MLKLVVQAIALANSMHAMRDTHGFGEFFGVKDLSPDFMLGDNFHRGVRYATDPVDRVRRPESAARRSHGHSIDSIVALVPRVDRFLRCEFAHRYSLSRTVDQYYKPKNQKSSKRKLPSIKTRSILAGQLDSAIQVCSVLP